MSKSRLIDTIILIMLLIGVATFPVNYLVHDLFWYYFIEALLMLAVLIFILFYETRHPEINPPKKRFNLENFLWLLPSVLVAFSNLCIDIKRTSRLFFWVIFNSTRSVYCSKCYYRRICF